LQLRAKTLSSGGFLELARSVVDDAREAQATVIINDRADLAVMARAHGVHVGQDDLSPGDVRGIIGPSAVVGFSTHTDAQIDAALGEPISYLAIGPVFSTATKETGYEDVGYGAITRAASRAVARALPVVAIGGITLETAPKALEAGAAAVAIITDLLTANPEQRVRQYLTALA